MLNSCNSCSTRNTYLFNFVLMKKYLITAVIVLTTLLLLTANYAVKQRAEKQRFESNQNALLDKVTYYRDAHGRAEASVQKLTLSVEEFKDKEAEYVNLCSELDVKIKRLQSASKTEVSNDIDITAPIHDTTIIHDTISEIVKAVVDYMNKPEVSAATVEVETNNKHHEAKTEA